MPRYEYVDHERNAHVITAPSPYAALRIAHDREYAHTGSLTLADRATGTVETSDERAQARR